MVAAVLHLHEGAARPFAMPVDRECAAVSVTAMMSLTTTFSSAADPMRRETIALLVARPAALSLLLIAEHQCDLGHVGEGLGLGLRRAARDHDARMRAARA